MKKREKSFTQNENFTHFLPNLGLGQRKKFQKILFVEKISTISRKLFSRKKFEKKKVGTLSILDEFGSGGTPMRDKV